MTSGIQALIACIRMRIGVWLCAAGYLTLPLGLAAQPVTLVEGGIPQMTLLAGSAPEPVAELQRYLKRISGTELPVGRPQPGSGAAMISMTPPDGLGYCECDRCFAVFQGAKPYAAYGSVFAKRPDGVVVNVTSETLFHFINQVAAAVAEKYPATWIGCYAYSAYSHPTSFPLHRKMPKPPTIGAHAASAIISRRNSYGTSTPTCRVCSGTFTSKPSARPPA